MNNASTLIREREPNTLVPEPGTLKTDPNTLETETSEQEPPNKIVANSIHFTYENTKILNNINLTVKEGEFLVLMGPSGCGKSTFLRLLAGLEQPQEGEILINEKSIKAAPPHCGVVFQDYSLFPWLNTRDNIALALKQRNPRLKKKELHHIAEQYLSLVNLANAGSKYPGQMSGGMRQRAAIARALSFGADLLFMDEPFGALDPITRVQLQDLLLQIKTSEKRTIIFVTHDAEEAIYLADRIILFTPAKGGAVTTSLTVPFNREKKERSHFFKTREFSQFREKLLNILNQELLKTIPQGTNFHEGAGI